MSRWLISRIGWLAPPVLAFSFAAEAARSTPVSNAEQRTEQMSIEAHKGLARRSIEMWAGNNRDKPEEVFASNYINHQEPDAKGGVTALDLAGWKAVVEENHRAFPDLKVQILMQIAEGDLVAPRWRFTATQTGAYLGHPPSGKQAIWTGVQVDRIESGKIVESWVDWDKFRMFDALGFIK